MRAGPAQRLERAWYSDARPGWLLRALEKFYFAGFRVHQRYQKWRRAADLEGEPIVVVGNLTAGGTGKTPFVIRLANLAREAGFAPGIISRGYGRSGKEPVSVSAGSDPRLCGDEPLLIARRVGCPVRVDPDREQAARYLLESGVDLVIADDGLQRTRLPRRLEICIVDRHRGAGNGHLLPAGPLREPLSRLQEYEIVVEHVRPGTDKGETGARTMQLEAGRFRRIDNDETSTAAELAAQGRPLRAVAGIANPQRFFDTLSGLGLHFEAHPFPDHHVFRDQDFAAFSGNEIVLMTEKDAVKCGGLGLPDAWYLPVVARFSESLEQSLTATLRSRFAGTKELTR